MSASNGSTAIRRRVKDDVDEIQTNGQLKGQGVSSIPQSQMSSPDSKTSPSAITIIQIWAPTLLLIFGGCCSNVYTLEALIQSSPSSGGLITAFQFLLVALSTLPRHLSPSRGIRNFYLKERNIPLRKWLVYTAYFLSINILNNMAFRYKISVPLHIILRSAGPVTTMLAGRIIKGRKYPTQKVVAVMLLFGGVVAAAISDAWAKQGIPKSTVVESKNEGLSGTSAGGDKTFIQATGFALLASALILSACMGLYTDDMYATHGRTGDVTAESLFYSHALSLPYFFSQVRPMFSEFIALTTLPGSKIQPISKSAPFSPTPSSFDSISTLLAYTRSSPILLLILNAATQLLCIIGVNRLSAQSSSLTVSIVLNIRKLTSLILSIQLFGNELPWGVLLGAVTVFLGGGLFALPSFESKSSVEKREVEQKKAR